MFCPDRVGELVGVAVVGTDVGAAVDGAAEGKNVGTAVLGTAVGMAVVGTAVGAAKHASYTTFISTGSHKHKAASILTTLGNGARI